MCARKTPSQKSSSAKRKGSSKQKPNTNAKAQVASAKESAASVAAARNANDAKAVSTARKTRYHTPKNAKVYGIEIELRDAHVATWRMVLVPDFMPLSSLHNVIQVLFDWTGGHLYFFERPAKKLFFDDPRMAADSTGSLRGEEHRLASEGTVKDLLPRKGSKALYVYDMGDYWELELRVGATIRIEDYSFPFMPVCTDGGGASPIEDSGGAYGYEMLSAAVNDPGHPNHKAAMEWLCLEEGEGIEEKFFDPHYANTVFADAMIAGNPDMVPQDPDELRKRYAELLADQFVMQVEMDLVTNAMALALDELVDPSVMASFSEMD